MKKLATGVLPHVAVILSLMFMSFLVLNDYNPAMDFLTNGISQGLLWALCACALVNAATIILFGRRARK